MSLNLSSLETALPASSIKTLYQLGFDTTIEQFKHLPPDEVGKLFSTLAPPVQEKLFGKIFGWWKESSSDVLAIKTKHPVADHEKLRRMVPQAFHGPPPSLEPHESQPPSLRALMDLLVLWDCMPVAQEQTHAPLPGQGADASVPDCSSSGSRIHVLGSTDGLRYRICSGLKCTLPRSKSLDPDDRADRCLKLTEVVSSDLLYRRLKLNNILWDVLLVSDDWSGEWSYGLQLQDCGTVAFWAGSREPGSVAHFDFKGSRIALDHFELLLNYLLSVDEPLTRSVLYDIKPYEAQILELRDQASGVFFQ